MHYVYILKDKTGKKYIGYSSNLKERIASHNYNKVSTTKRYKEHELIWYCAFKNKKKALEFESYLKKGSGYALMNKRLV